MQILKRKIRRDVMPPLGVATWTLVQKTSTAAHATTFTLNLPNVAVGDLLIVGYSNFNQTPSSISDGFNTWNTGPQGGNSGLQVGGFWTIATTGGNLAITVTYAGNNFAALGAAEFSVPPGASITHIATDQVGSAGSGTAMATANTTFSGPGSFLIWGAGGSEGFNVAPGTGFAAINTVNYGPGVNEGYGDEYRTATSGASPLPVTSRGSSSGVWSAAGMVFLASSITCLPARIPSNHGGNISLALGSTGMTPGTPGTPTFSISGVAGVTKISQTVTTPTSATLVVTTGATTGTLAITDGVSTGNAVVAAATITTNPIGFGQGVPATVTVTGTNTVWTQETASTLFSASGGTSPGVSSIVVVNDHTATLTLNPGSTATTGTLTDNSTGATVTYTVFTAAPSITFAPNVLIANTTRFGFTLTGLHTKWNTAPLPTWTVTGVAGVAMLGSVVVTSDTAATVTLSSGITTGTLTISDGSYSTTMAVLPAATVNQAYISRNGRTAYFLVSDTTATLTSQPPLVNYAITGATVTAGGTSYVAPVAAISGGVALTLTCGGSGYTSAPAVSITGGGGSGASATALLSSGLALTLTNGGSGYSSAPAVNISGGSGSGASATATISGGVVTGLVVIPGTGYLNGAVPSVTITGGGGTLAAATAWIPSGAVSGFTVVPGTGYTSAPAVAIFGSGGLYATATAAVISGGGTGCLLGTPVVSGGVIQSIPVVAYGSGYTSAPAVTITDSTGTGAAATLTLGGTPAAITAVNAHPTIKVNGNAVATPLCVTRIPIVNPGSGYTQPPGVTFSGGGGSGASATTSYGPNGTLAINLTGGGSYTSTPSVTILSGLGTGATATANWDASDAPKSVKTLAMTAGGTGYLPVTITGGSGSGASAIPLLTVSGGISLTLTSGGSGYTTPPVVTITGGGGNNDFSAQAKISAAGAVIGFIVSPGSGYGAGATVVISGGGGSGATATLSFAAGCVYGVQMVSTGSGYLPGDTVTVTIGAPSSGVTATAVAVLGPVWTAASQTWPFVPYQLECGGVQSVLVQTGGANYTSPVATATGGGGTGLVLGTPVVAQGVISAIGVTTPGTANTRSNTVKVTDSTHAGSGFVGLCTASNSGVQKVIVEAGGSNYSSTPANLSVGIASFNGSPSGYAFQSPTLANNVIVSIPVTNPGTGYTSAPTITLTDGGSGAGAVAVAIMSGPLSTDTVTYSAPANWLATVLPPVTPADSAGGVLNAHYLPATGSVGASVNVAMPNFSGAIEPMFGQSPALMEMGIGIGEPNSFNSGYQKQQNWLKLTGAWKGAIAPLVTITPHAGDVTGVYAAAVAVVDLNGTVTGLTITCGGAGYTIAPDIVIAAPPVAGVTATATATISGGIVTSIAMVINGSGYGGGHAVTLAGPSFVVTGNRPTAINAKLFPDGTATTKPTVTGGIAQCNSGTTVDQSSPPDLAGVWSFVADETARLTPMTVTLYASNASGVVTLIAPAATYPQAGTVVGGSELGKKWAWNVTRTTQSVLNIQLSITGPAAALTAPYTLTNEFMAAPVRATKAIQTIDTTKPYAPDPNLISWLSPPGGPYPAWIRCSSFGAWSNGDSNVVEPTDLQSASAFNYFGGADYSVVGISIRQYQVSAFGTTHVPYPGWQSPVIWTNEAYPGTVATGGGPWPYAWTPPNNTIANNLDFFANKTPGPYTTVAGEVTTATPHGFKTGEVIEWSGGPGALQFYDEAGGGPTTIGFKNFSGPVFVTSATTFAFTANGVSINPNNAHVCNVNATYTGNFLIYKPIPSGGGSLPFEVLASMVGAVPGCGMHTFIPPMATDATITQIATTIRDNLPLYRRVLPEYTDEHWNSFYPHANCMQMFASLCSVGTSGIRPFKGDDFFTWRQAQIHNIFVSVFNSVDINGNTNRGGSIVRAFGSQDSGAGVTANIAGFANLYNATSPAIPIQVDAILRAPYDDINVDAPIVNAAASTYSNYPGSLQYQSTVPWPMGDYVDLVRHHEMYTTLHVTYGAAQVAAIAGYVLAPGQTAPPYFIGYEGSIQTAVPPGPALEDWQLRADITCDLSYHPYYYDANRAYFTAQQIGGLAYLQANEICYPRGPANTGANIGGNNDKYGTALWEYTTWEGQTWGKGDGSTDGNGNNTVNLFFNGTGVAQELNNVSPKLASWRDWTVAANPAPYNPTNVQFLLATEGGDVFAATASMTVTSSMAVTEGRDVLAGSATTFTAALLGTEAGDVFAATAQTVVTVSMAATERHDTFSSGQNKKRPKWFSGLSRRYTR
jgi:hypothetical protein